jgi:GNAT superfamily N-acetyltransferase
MTDISATSFFRQSGLADDGGIDFEHEETNTGGSKWPTKVVLKALHPETGEQMGFLNYNVPRRKADRITVQRLETHEDHRGKGVGSALMDEMQRRHPGTPIDHGDRTPDGNAWWNKYSDGKKVTRGRTMATVTPIRPADERPSAESYARQDGEDWMDHQRRVRHGLSMGHLTYEQAKDHRYSGDSREDTRHDGYGPDPTTPKGWQPLPKQLYHTTTDAAGVAANGLRSGGELGQNKGHGLGGTPEWLSLTDRHDNAHHMLDALHEYHDHLNGKTNFPDLHRAAENGEGAEKPFHKALTDGLSEMYNEHHRESLMRGKRIEPGFATHDEAKERGWTPHPTLHKDFGEDKHGRRIGTGWERDSNLDERHDEYGAFSRARQWSGNGKPSVLFTSNDRQAFADKDPSNFAVLPVRPRPGGHGFPGGDKDEWRTGTGDAVEVHGEPIRRQALRFTAAVQDGDDIPSRLLNPHGHHVKARVGGHTNVEMVPRDEVERYASQPTDDAHTKEVGTHVATTGEMEPLILHYHPASGEAYLGEGNHRLRASRALGMDHVPVRVSRSNYGLPGPGVKVPQDHPAIAAGEHVPADIHPSHIGLTTVDKPSIPQVDLDSARHDYRLTGRPRLASADTLHRGVLVEADPNDLVEAHKRGGMPAVHEHIRNLVTSHRGGGLGTHWSSEPAISHEFSQGHGFEGDRANVPHTDIPYQNTMHIPVKMQGRIAPEHHETDPDALDSARVQGHGWHSLNPDRPPERETLVRPGSPVHLTGMQASLPAHPDWVHHVNNALENWEHEDWGHTNKVPHAWQEIASAGRHTASADTPVPDNTKPYQHEHDWLPHGHFFAPGEKGLDPRLFDENDRMHPIVRQHLLSLLNSFWAPKYGDSWQSWARVYLTGSEASHWYGNNDLDVLIGVDHEALNHHIDTFTGEPEGAVDEHLTNELREGLNDDARMLPGPDGKETGPWESTFYVNPGSYDIRDLKPYAAYDITRDEWAVKPVEVPDDFGPEKLPESTWDVFDALQKLIKAIAELPDSIREREGAALYDYLHADRHSAFGPEGSGLYDPGNVIFKALDKAPGKPLQQLIDWKHAHDGAAATDLETAA